MKKYKLLSIIALILIPLTVLAAKLTDEPELTTPASNDLLMIVDVSDATDNAAGSTKKISINTLGITNTSVDFDDHAAHAGTIQSIGKTGVDTVTHTPLSSSEAIFTNRLRHTIVDLTTASMIGFSHAIAGYDYLEIIGNNNSSQQFVHEAKLDASGTGTHGTIAFYKPAINAGTYNATTSNFVILDNDIDLSGESGTATNYYFLRNTISDAKIQTAGTIIAGRFNVSAPSEITIASGVTTITTGYHSVDTEADAASDDLRTINGGSAGDLLYLFPANDARTVVLKDYAGGGDNLSLNGDFSLDSTSDTIVLLYNGLVWQEISRSDNS